MRTFADLAPQTGTHAGRRRAPHYAIALELDAELLAVMQPGRSISEAYAGIRRTLERRGFARRQGTLYFGDESVTAVTCVLAVQELAHAYAWFASCVREVRMLRIEEAVDLRPAIDVTGRDRAAL